jgi:hypothetical protein
LVIAGSIALLVGSRVGEFHRIAFAREAIGKYNIDYDPVIDRIDISGIIGPRFATRLEQLIGHNAVSSVRIRSPGRLVDEALRAADAIDRAKINTATQEECNSACIILFAGNKRLADYSMQLGFHKISPITQLDAISESTLAFRTGRVRRFLSSRGVLDEVLDKAEATGSEALFPVNSIDLAETGFVTQTTAGGHEIDTRLAEWIWVEDVLKQRSTESVSLLVAFRKAGLDV